MTNERPPAIEASIVNEYVISAHGNFERLKELTAEHHTLVNAVWDWGGGDYESAIGAAAHTGQREIAEFLLANGARIDLYVAAMLGQLSVVKAIISANPTAKDVPGAHRIPLMVHALKGGESAQAVVDYLESLG